MVLPRSTENQNIVKEHNNKVPKIPCKNIVHECLKGRGCVSKSERHDQEFEVAMMGPECRLWDVLGVHQNLVKPGT